MRLAYDEDLKDCFKVRNLFGELKNESDSTKEIALNNLGITKEMLDALKLYTAELAAKQLQSLNNG